VKYFVTVQARSRRQWRELGDLDLDLVLGTAKREERTMTALCTMADVERLAQLGYRVTIEEPGDARARARKIASFDAWLETVR